MENEIMNYEDELVNDVEIVELEPEDSGLSTAAAMAIGAGLTLAVTAVVKLGKKLVADHKAKKELRLVEEDKIIEPTDEEIKEVTEK